MDIIVKQAQRFADNVFDSGVGNYERILSDVRSKASGIDNKLDRIRFININLEKNNSIYEKHKLDVEIQLVVSKMKITKLSHISLYKN